MLSYHDLQGSLRLNICAEVTAGHHIVRQPDYYPCKFNGGIETIVWTEGSGEYRSVRADIPHCFGPIKVFVEFTQQRQLVWANLD
jgi:hypothetical protein